MIKARQYSSKITIVDICSEIKNNLDVITIQNNPLRVRQLIALLSTKLNNQYKMVTDFTYLDSHMKYQKNMFSLYLYNWRHTSLIVSNTSKFINETQKIFTVILPKNKIAV